LAFPGMPPQMREVTACDHFLDALGDPDFALKIRERHPSNLELVVALRTSLRLEAWTANTTKCCKVEKKEQGESNVMRILDKIVDSIEAFQKKVEKKFAELEKRFPRRPKNGGFLNNCRQINSNRHIAPNFNRGVSSALPGSRGLNPVNCPNNSVRPPSINRTNCNGNFNRLPSCRRISCLSRRQDLEESRTAEVPEQRPARSEERAGSKAVRSELRSTDSERRPVRPDQRYQEKSEQHSTNPKQINLLEKVNEQTIQNNQAGGGLISIDEPSEPSACSVKKFTGKVFDQQKWHQRLLPAKNKSAHRSKRRVSVPALTPCGTELTSDVLQNSQQTAK